MYWSIIYLAGDTGHPLGNKWQDSEEYRILTGDLDPILDKTIDQPDGIAPKYATNPLTQVSIQCQYSQALFQLNTLISLTCN